ncbi:hypothetical protein JCM5350_006323 [Sporobolomyces pararoseus]
MSSAHSTLFYGVFVKSYSLCFAAEAFSSTKNSLLAIDIIRNRRKRGTLSVGTPRKALTKIPEEVWQIVKEQIIESATLAIEQDDMEATCRLCPCHPPRGGYPKRWELKEVERFEDTFWEAFYYEWGGTVSMLENRREVRLFYESFDQYKLADPEPPTRKQKIKDLLVSHGLTQPFTSPYGPTSEDDPTLDFELLSAISLPLYSTSPQTSNVPIDPSRTLSSFPRSTAVDTSLDSGASSHNIVRFSHSNFNFPADSNLRLKRFLSLFNLRIEDPSGPTFHSTPAPTLLETVETNEEASKEKKGQAEVEKKKEKDKEDREKVCCARVNLEPHWHMLTTFESVW